MLLVPTPESVAVLKLDDGEVAAKSNIRSAGNLLALDDQLVLVDDESLHTYMDWDSAYQRLSRMAQDATADPKPGLWLAHLAINARQRDAAIEGIDASLTALTAMGTFHADEADFDARYDEAFNRLLALAQEPDRVDAALKKRLFEQLAVNAMTPKQQVDQRFAEAVFLAASGSPEKAVDQYQAVLFDQAMSQQLYLSASGAQPARNEAHAQIVKLVEKHGRQIYQTYEDAAARSLADLKRTDAAAAAFVDLARRFPAASSATAAMIAGADRLQRDGNLRESIRVLHIAYADVREQPALLQDVVGRLVTYSLDASQPRQALRWLRQAAREDPDLRPLRDGQPIAIADWIRLIEPQTTAARRLPELSLPLGQPVTLDGRLLTPTDKPMGTASTGLILTLLGQQVIAWDSATLAKRWTAELPSTQVELVHLSASNVVLLTDVETSGATLQILDTRDGQRIGEMISLGDAAEQIAPNVPQAGQQIELRSQIHPTHNHARNVVMLHGRFVHGAEAEAILARDRRAWFAAANETVIIVADRVGRTLALDSVTGEVLWRMRCAFDRVEFLELTDEALVLGGAMGVNDTILDGAVWVLDPVTAAPRMILQELGTVPSWVRVSEDGILTYLVSGELVARYVGGGPALWMKDNLPVASPVAVRAMAGNRLVYQMRPGYLRILDVTNGNEVGDIQLADSDTQINMQADGEMLYLQSGEQILAIDKDGQVSWRDAIERSNKRLQLQLVGDKYIATVALRGGPAVNPDAMGAAPAGLEGLGVGVNNREVVIHLPAEPARQVAIAQALERLQARNAAMEAENADRLEAHRQRVQKAMAAAKVEGQNLKVEAEAPNAEQAEGVRVVVRELVEAGPLREAARGADLAEAPERQVPANLNERPVVADRKAQLGPVERVEAIAQLAQAGPAGDGPAMPVDGIQPVTYTYVMYLFEREGGLMVAEIAMPATTVPLDPDHAAIIDGRILLTTSRQTIVLPGAPPAANP
jgi:hypothetical protein